MCLSLASLQRVHHNGDGGHHTYSRNGPCQNLDDLDLVAFAEAAHDLALELLCAVGYAFVGAFYVAPHVVDDDSGNDPEDGADYEKDLCQYGQLGGPFWKGRGRGGKEGHTVCSMLWNNFLAV
jgi:hypothetical protein